MSLFDLWEQAAVGLRIEHIDPSCDPIINVLDTPEPFVTITVHNARDPQNHERRVPYIEALRVRTAYWPGERLARAWLAVAWSVYVQQRALELVFEGDHPVLDPAGDPDLAVGLRRGFPAVLTPETLALTLELAMTHEHVVKLISAGSIA